MSQINVFIVNKSFSYKEMFKRFGFNVLESTEEDVPDLVCFTGGEDVSPSLYNESKHPTTGNNINRDVVEKEIFNECVELNIPMVGICRGGQFLNVMNGGKMYQHVSNHTTNHLIKDVKTGVEFIATSTHHQMMRPAEYAKIIAIANNHGFKEYMSEDGYIIREDKDIDDIEVVYYPQTNSLCFQPHPEFGSTFLQKYFFDCIEEYLF